MKIVLASASLRRKEMFEELGIPVEVVAPGIEESRLPGETPVEFAMRLAGEKGLSVATELPAEEGEAVVVAADTVVTIDDQVLGKPVDGDDARRMLGLLSGKTHSVVTGYAVGGKKGNWTVAFARTEVTFFPLGESEMEEYVATGECDDKAGAYGIQGAGRVLVERLEGSYPNVVGLPIELVVRELKARGALD